jgi:hypothetical protein
MTTGEGTPFGKSDSPILYLGISKSYLRAFEILWESEFADRHPFNWDKSLIFHPISHILGLTLETAMKGLLVCRSAKSSHSHDLEDLLRHLDDPKLETSLDESLHGLVVPQDLLDANEHTSPLEIEAMYRRHHIHFHLLNQIYKKPYATRYPVIGGIALPDPVALAKMSLVVQEALGGESRSWRPAS